ncbi:MAG TPA: hypothetical protein VFD58_10145 [Blastocatellia bacterium]|nr:hypothetical protein [Blastocatellia bacterium]
MQPATEPQGAKSDPIPTRPWSEVAAPTGQAVSGSYSPAKQVGTITDEKLSEVSGITAGRANAGVWWVNNDSGNPAEIYALDANGRLLATFAVTGANNVDWEDIAGGPGRDGKPALYIADIGDNRSRRNEVIIYRVNEPLLGEGVKTGATEQAERFPFQYPDGKHDAEALFVDPKAGRIYIVTKLRDGGCKVYRSPMPLAAGQEVVLEEVKGSAVSEISKLPMVTGASAAPDGSRVIIRTYLNAIELRRETGGAFETIFNSTPVPVDIPLERQGEAIGYTADGKSVVTTGEKVPAPIYQMTRR